VVPLFKRHSRRCVEDFCARPDVEACQLFVEDETGLVEKYSNKFIDNILKPLNNLQIIDPRRNYFILIDGIDDVLLQTERLLNNFGSRSPILEFLNRTFLFFPHWLNLIFTSKRGTEKLTLRKYLPNVNYDKLIMDKCVNLNSIRPLGLKKGVK
jgi:hypothetical protein